MITTIIATDYITAVKENDVKRRDTLKLVKAALYNMLIEKKHEGVVPTDKDGLEVLQKLVKKGEDAKAQYEKAGDTERAAAEAYEINLYRSYLPKQLDAGEVLAVVDATFKELDLVPTAKAKGTIIKAVKAKLGENTTGQMISTAVDSFIRFFSPQN